MDGQLKIISTVDAVSRAIEHSIYTLEYEPGQQIKEGELAARFSVSRNTVREAIAFLLNNGLLTKQVNRGVFVRKITPNDVCEVFHLRKLFEEEAMRAIIANEVIPISVVHALEVVESIDIVNNWYEYVTRDVAFHTALVEASNSPRLARLYATISAEVMLCIYQSKEIILPHQENFYEHRLFLEALESGDADKAVRLVDSHIDYAISKFMEGFQARDRS